MQLTEGETLSLNVRLFRRGINSARKYFSPDDFGQKRVKGARSCSKTILSLFDFAGESQAVVSTPFGRRETKEGSNILQKEREDRA